MTRAIDVKLMYEKTLLAPTWQNAVLSGIGPKVAESGIGLIAEYPFSAPYERREAQITVGRHDPGAR